MTQNGLMIENFLIESRRKNSLPLYFLFLLVPTRSFVTRGSRFGFWKSKKQHKFNKPSVLISNYLDFFEQTYQVYQLQNVGLDMVDLCKC
jgi:hypothetical protein